MEMTLTSNAFTHEQPIPRKYTADGENINPDLHITNVPDGVASLVLIVDDPDAATDPDGPGAVFTHWLLYNILPSTGAIGEDSVPANANAGQNGMGENGYTGPNPPNGAHRYHFELFALDTKIDLPDGATKDQVLQAMDGHIVTETRLTGLYQKSS